jgi:hypothetical protein
MAEDTVKSEPAKPAEPAESRTAPGGITPDMSADEAVEVLYRNAFRDLEDGDPDASETPLSNADRERVRTYIRAGFRPGMSREEAAGLQEAAVQDLLRALEFGLDGSLETLLREVRGLGEVITQIKEARQSATKGS